MADVGQGGLLDVTVDPAFANNRLLWLAYSEPASDGTNSTSVARARLSADGTTLEDDALPELWSYGHRNVQGAAIHPETGKLWISEHGPRGGDELNVLEPGGNYGWPLVSHGVEYSGQPVGRGRRSAPGLEDPVSTWTPAIAPGGIAFYRSGAFPGWRGNLLVSGLRARAILRLELEGEAVVHEERLIADEGRRIRDVAVGPDGVIYALTDDERDGSVLRLTPGG